MKTSRPNTIKSLPLITGFFREVLFFSRTISLNTVEKTIELTLLTIDEPAARTKSKDRFLILKPVAFEGPFETTNSILEFRCTFPRFVGTWHSEIVIRDDGTIEARVPETLEISDQRGAGRLEPLGHQTLSCPVLIQTGGLHAEVSFEVENVSTYGLGGILRAPSGIPVRADTKITGRLDMKDGSLSIRGQVVQAILIQEQDSKSQSVCYRVGIQSAHEHSPTPAESKAERRQLDRSKITFEIELYSPLNPTHAIQFKVEDVSAGGFSGTLVEEGDQFLLPIGWGVKLKASTMLAELVGLKGDKYRFQFTHGEEKDRLDWLRTVSRFDNKHTVAHSSTGRDLIELFCEAGALSSQYIKNHSTHAKAFASGLANSALGDTWIHRWIEKTDHGETKGHISAIKFGDNMWFIGDIAGSTDSDRKLSETFIPKFVRGFRDFCLSTSPCPKILGSWNVGHPYWRDFETFLATTGKPMLLGDTYTQYFRTASDIPMTEGSPVELKRVNPSEMQTISKVCENLANPNDLHLLRALDFNADTFSSPNLRKSIHSRGLRFHREYVTLTHGGNRWLAVLSSFPLGSSINRTSDAVWLFPLGGNSAIEADRTTIHSAIRTYALAQGLTYPGILETMRPDSDSTPGATKAMRWVLMHPKAFDWFRAHT